MQKNINIFSHVWTPVPEQMADFTASCFCHQMSHWFHTGVETQSSTNSLKRNLPTTNHYQRSTITQSNLSHFQTKQVTDECCCVLLE